MAAMKQYRERGPAPYSESTTYDLIHEGRRYPPVAIVGIAAQALDPEFRDYRGGEGSEVFRELRQLGFVVQKKTDWTELECWFAVWAYDQLDRDRQIKKAELYERVAHLIGRSSSAVERKISNVAAVDPRPSGKPVAELANYQKRVLPPVFEKFWANRDAERDLFDENVERVTFGRTTPIGLTLDAAGTPSESMGSDVSRVIWSEEGAEEIRETKTRKRDRKLVEAGREHYRDEDGRLRCRACGFVAPTGTPGGSVVVQLHHTEQLADFDEQGRKLRLEEAVKLLLPLCPTCHALSHTQRPPLRLEEIRALLGMSV